MRGNEPQNNRFGIDRDLERQKKGRGSGGKMSENSELDYGLKSDIEELGIKNEKMSV